MISLREVNGEVIDRDDVITCDVIASDVTESDIIISDVVTTDVITNDIIEGDVEGTVVTSDAPLEDGLMLEEQIVETSEDSFFQVVENETTEVPSAGHLVTMSADGTTLSSEVLSENLEGDEGEEEKREEEEERKEAKNAFSVVDAKEMIEVYEDLVPFQDENEVANILPEDVEEPEGTKRLFIQDANGQVFYIQCPEGFTVEPDIVKRESALSKQVSHQSAEEPSSSSSDDTSFSSSSSAKRLSAWLSPSVHHSIISLAPAPSSASSPSDSFSTQLEKSSWRKRPREDLPRLKSCEFNRQVNRVLPTMTMDSPTDSASASVGKKDPDKIGQRMKQLTKKLRKEFRETKKGLRPPPKSDSQEIKYETGFDPVSGEVKGPDIDIGDIATSSFVEREVNSADDVCKLWTLTPRDKQILRKKGIKWREGPWGEDEVEILDDNIKNYCLDRNYEDPSKVIFSMTKEDRKDFYPIIARGICRPVFAVYRRVLRDYDPNNHKGVYTKSELDMLNRLLEEHGPDYKLISETLGRSIESVRDRCRHLSDGRIPTGKSQSGSRDRQNAYNRGKWVPDEEKRLIIAVHEVQRNEKSGGAGGGGAGGGGRGMGISKSSATEGKDSSKNDDCLDDIPWMGVATLVETRSPAQCRRKWAEILKRSAESRREEAEEKSTDFALLSNLNKVLTPEPLTLQPLDVVSATLPTPINLARLQDEPLLHHQPHQNQIFQTFQQQQQPHQTYQQQQPQHIDFVVTRPKPPMEELILFEGVDDQTFSNLQLNFITPIE